MKTIPWDERKHFAALDCASDHHHVVVVDQRGAVGFELRIEHTAEGWAQLREKLRTYEPLAVAVETNQGMAVEQLLAAGYTVYPVNPKIAVRYRERKAPTGVKGDRARRLEFGGCAARGRSWLESTLAGGPAGGGATHAHA